MGVNSVRKRRKVVYRLWNKMPEQLLSPLDCTVWITNLGSIVWLLLN